MAKYKVTDKDGNEVNPGDTIHNFRGEPGVFESVSRGPEYNGTAKVVVDGYESYSRAWNLTVEPMMGENA